MCKIINFHDTKDSSWFEKTMVILKSKYNMISVKDLEKYYTKGQSLNNSCHITVDDGAKTFYGDIKTNAGFEVPEKGVPRIRFKESCLEKWNKFRG